MSLRLTQFVVRMTVGRNAMSETLERSSADRARTVRHILADLRSHQVDGVVVAEIREAMEQEEEEDLKECSRWLGVVLMGLILAVLLALWCRGII